MVYPGARSVSVVLCECSSRVEPGFSFLNMEIRNIAIIAPVVAAALLPENPRFSARFALLSDTGKRQFSRPLSHAVRK